MKKHNSIYSLIIFFLCTLIFTGNITFAETSNLDISAASVILIDGKTSQILYKKNENTKHYPASITKLMTALLALENLDLNDSITFSRNAVLSIEYGSSHIGIQEDETLTIDQAMHGLLLMSANEVANGLAEETSGSIEAFAEVMNARAELIGAKNTHFVNPHGLHDDNHYTTAYDMALIAKELANNESFLKIMKDITYEIPPTNKVAEIRYLSQQHKMMNEKRDATLFRPDVIGGKTGYTNEAGHTLVTIAKKGDQILIAVILNGNGNEVYKDTNQLLDYGFSQFNKTTLEQQSYMTKVPIKENGEKIGDATITLDKPVEILLPTDEDASSIQYKTDITELESPVKEGKVIGKVTILNGSEPLIDADLIVDKVSIEYIVQEAAPKTIPWLLIGFSILVTIMFMYLIILKFMSRKRYPKVNNSRKNHYSNYVNKRLKN